MNSWKPYFQKGPSSGSLANTPGGNWSPIADTAVLSATLTLRRQMTLQENWSIDGWTVIKENTKGKKRDQAQLP